MIALLADGSILTKLTCQSTECMSYIISLMDIMTVLYLAFCASFRVTKGVRIFGWIWAAVVIAGTITVIALHTCLFTLVSALFTALILMALFGVTFESIATKKREDAKAEEKEEKPAPAAFVCPMAAFACPMAQCAPQPAPVEATPAPQAPKAEPIEEEVAADKEESLSLQESLALAKESKKASDVINKKYVADFLTSTFGEDVECNMRGNYTSTNLPLADTHYAIGKEGKKCFIYVYETDAAVVLLLKLSEEYAESVRASGHRIIRSAFPKSKDAWYSVIADATYTEEDVQEILTDACNMAKAAQWEPAK